MRDWSFLFISLLLFTSEAFAGAGQSWAHKAFASQKIQLPQSDQYSTDQPLLLMVDASCLQQSQKGKPRQHFRGFDLLVKDSPGVEFPGWTAYPQAGISPSELEASLLTEECLIGVSAEARTQVAAVSDPKLNEQIAWSAIRLSEGDDFFRHPLWGVGKPVVAAVIDSGLQLNHPDLSPRLWQGPAGQRGHDFVNDDGDPSDDHGHGTHVAGILGAQSQNGIGGRGVMGDWIQMMALKTQDEEGGGSLADLVNALQWAADHGVEVINLSISARQKNTAVEGAIQYAIGKGAVVLAAAGNDGEEVTATNFFLPSGYAKDNGGLISVGSYDALTFLRSSFSNFSSTFIEMTAPGSVQGSPGLLSTFLGSGYLNLKGTSQATPQVSGAAALSISFYKTHSLPYSPAQIEQVIQHASVTPERRLDMKRLGILLFNSGPVAATGGFDDE